jgi:hypothetical protein
MPGIGNCSSLVLMQALLWLLCASAAIASPLFDDDTVINVTITGPLSSLLEDTTGSDYLPFTLESDGLQQAVEIRLRGHSRRRVCEFPPLRLKFPVSGAEQGVFAGQNRLKLVSHCRNYDRGEQDLLEEYAAYRIMNQVTDLSYKVRLLRIQYRDSEGQTPEGAESRFGFAIEPKQEFAARTGTKPAVLDGFPLHRHDDKQAALVYVMQYLLGNTDWMMLKADYDEECCHNLDLYELDSRVVLVPYDFDVTGLVNARYAYPDPKLRIKRVTQRLYRGLCTEHEYLREALKVIHSKRAEILNVIEHLPGLDPRNKDRASRYLEDFFEDTEDEERLLKLFEKRCLTGY